MSQPHGIDPRGPRFAATITATLLAVTILLALTAPAGVILTPAFFALLIVTALFAWGVASPETAPWGVLYRRVVAPRLAPPTEQEDPRPPRFAQGVGLVVAGAGVLLHLIGVPHAILIAAVIAFAAAFLNVAFNFCLGCQMYLLLQRIRSRATA